MTRTNKGTSYYRQQKKQSHALSFVPSLLIIFFLSIFSASGETNTAVPTVISPQPMATGTQSTWVGGKKCISCHEMEHRHWLTTSHAKSWETLKSKGEENNPSCLRCHTTGYGDKSGFTSREETPQLMGVQCEACHGPASSHLESKSGWTWIKKDCPVCNTRRVCMACHTPTHSPNFNLHLYLDKIKHPND